WRDAQACERWNLMNPGQAQRQSYLSKVLADEQGPFIATSDNVRLVAEQINPFVPGGLYALGTDGMGRSDTRFRLRRHFEVDAECTALAALSQLARQGKFDTAKLADVVRDLGIDPQKVDPYAA